MSDAVRRDFVLQFLTGGYTIRSETFDQYLQTWNISLDELDEHAKKNVQRSYKESTDHTS